MFCCSSLKSPTCGGKGLPPDLSHWSWRWSLGLEEVGTALSKEESTVFRRDLTSAVGEVSPSVAQGSVFTGMRRGLARL